MWNEYPGAQHHRRHHGGGGYGPPPGPPPQFSSGPPPGPPPSGYSSYGPPPGPPPTGPRPDGYRGFDDPYYSSPPSGPPPGYGGYDGYGLPPGPPTSSYQNGYQGYGAPPSGPPHMPPSEIQNYGPQFQDAGNGVQQPYFQYSQCTGRRKALCIGINYFGQSAELRGCINDAQNVQRFLIEQYNYNPDDIVLLTDDSDNPRQIPTKDNMIQAMYWLVQDAQPHDSLFFHYSGHGGQTKDIDGDEEDGYDEVIYPVDYESAGQLVDDELHKIMVRPLPPGCRLTSIFDSCHSGSVLDLPYLYSTEGKIKEPNLAAEAGMGVLNAVTSYARGDMGGVFQSAIGLFKTASGSSQRAEQYARATRTSPADVISWSGCKDSQTSADTVEAGRATGAMSYAFISCLSQNPQQSYQQLLIGLREILRNRYSQKPQLSSSHPMDTSIIFIM